MQGRLFESGWGKRAQDEDFFRENLVNSLLRDYSMNSMYQQIRGKNEDTLTGEEILTKDEIEVFVTEVVSNRFFLREQMGSEGFVSDSIGKYLDNPMLQNPKITDHLLVDLLDDELILLERDFHIGLFKGENIDVDTVTLFAAERGYFPAKYRMNWLKRFIWKAGILFVSGLLIYKGWEAIQNPSSQNWFGVARILIGILIIIFVTIGRLIPLKSRRVRRRIAELAFRFQVVRFEIAEQPYYAKTLIERLKKLEDQGLGVNSLIYALLELRC